MARSRTRTCRESKAYIFPYFTSASDNSLRIYDLASEHLKVGLPHGNDYEVYDPDAACVRCAKWQLGMLKLLLENSAERAKKVLAEFKPQFASKEEFLAYKDSLDDCGDRINYTDTKAEVRL